MTRECVVFACPLCARVGVCISRIDEESAKCVTHAGPRGGVESARVTRILGRENQGD